MAQWLCGLLDAWGAQFRAIFCSVSLGADMELHIVVDDEHIPSEL